MRTWIFQLGRSFVLLQIYFIPHFESLSLSLSFLWSNKKKYRLLRGSFVQRGSDSSLFQKCYSVECQLLSPEVKLTVCIFSSVYHIRKGAKNKSLEQAAWLWYSSYLPGCVLKFQTCQSCFVFIILFVQRGRVPSQPPCHSLAKKTKLTATTSFHCTKYCALVPFIIKICPIFEAVIAWDDTGLTTSLASCRSQVERLHAPHVGDHTDQHMALTYMSSCQQGQMCWDSLKSRKTFIKDKSKAANICRSAESSSIPTPIWQLISSWPHNHHHFSLSFHLTYQSLHVYDD